MKMSESRPAYLVRGGGGPLRGACRAARDKSISHRAILLGGFAAGETVIEDPLDAIDVARSLDVVHRLGAWSTVRDGRLIVRGPVRPETGPWDLDAGASGTTARLALGLLAGQNVAARLDGGAGLRRRPMDRVTTPLAAMGARFRGDARTLPLQLAPGPGLRGFDHRLTVASAQVATACLFAGLFAEGETSVTVPGPCRDHTERMLPAFGVPVRRDGSTSVVSGPATLSPARIHVPVDLSSALYPLVAALLIPGSDLVLEGVGVNPTRTGALEVLARMGADITIGAERQEGGGEPVADLRARTSELRGADVPPELFPRLVDDVPILAVAAAAAVAGATTFHGAGELRVKESDRIESVAEMLRRFGARVSVTADSLTVLGGGALAAADIDAAEDHRVAMSAAILGATLPGETIVRDVDVVRQSYPGFAAALSQLGVDIAVLNRPARPEGAGPTA